MLFDQKAKYFIANNQDKIIENHNEDVYDTKSKEPKSHSPSRINSKTFLPNLSSSSFLQSELSSTARQRLTNYSFTSIG